ncbi:MAG: thiamine pyrophosphate-dependent dehydrogenase E1 component subunit alpha [Bradymonadaceae bacterium]|nr:thiamine pyrophosphate-dependent dehydrogenase E1 component subunit alpha [Lujinxingiaceae bacterium]
MSNAIKPHPLPDPRTRFVADARPSVQKLYEQVALIRNFEERLLDLFEAGELFGTTHCYIGQEANAAGIINHLGVDDIVFSNHRCHGHFLTYADRPDLLMGELMGRASGLVGGRGGSQHICHSNFYSNGVQGGIVPAATGMALAEKIKGSGAVAVVFLGDGTLGQGVVYESLNMASLWGAPVVFVVENNRWAQSTPVERELAGDMVARGAAFGIDAGQIDSTDAEELYAHFQVIFEKVRATNRPHFEVIHTYRLCHHSKSDDMRPEDEIARFRANEPLPKLRARLAPAIAQRIDEAVAKRVDDAIVWARAQPFPEPGGLGHSLIPPRRKSSSLDQP